MSDNCRFDMECNFKLCQYKHNIRNEDVERDTQAENEYQKYDNMDEEEQYVVNKDICGGNMLARMPQISW